MSAMRFKVRMTACPNCRETKAACACLRNTCIKCGLPVGNITFTVCDTCWDEGKPKLPASDLAALKANQEGRR